MEDKSVCQLVRDPENVQRLFIHLEDGTIVGPYLVMSVERIGLRIGNVCDERVQELLRIEDATHQAIEDAVVYVKRKARTEAEVLQFLVKQKNYTPTIALEALAWLRKYQAINDGELISTTVSAAQKTVNTPSKMALTAKLLRRGVTKDQIIKALQVSEYDEFRGALQAGRKKLEQIERKLEHEELPPEERERKLKTILGAFLGRKGYSASTIHKVFDQLLG
ncbi:MAG: RecX family transcriptional regulator [Acidibacillus sp.]|uniref:Regulatory protein RecX n=1 Tax=Sulfoacidibacillus ferrooxidans TaxID=2005001 RepID=A0A9X1VC74_9BACL|nr:RecX family transcriptional regulator [Sulfoacidibacillus ferrooxidans]MCI0183658.1 Regulatory protein RecX [Sulfoacidibacillus ferrooxidans]MCY0892022.1 RecX family transcriptional regulator [Acidibacillus sp.]